jgi:serine protease Do
MSDFYDFNSSNHDCENNFTFPDVPVEPTDRTGRKARKNRRSSRNHPLAKKVGTLTLSALLFGSVSAGAFQAVNTLSGYTESRLAASSTSDSESSGHLLKATTISNEQTTDPSASMDVSSIVKSAMPSIVSITNKSVQEVQNYFSRFGYGYMQPQLEETESCGSGIIIGKNNTELLIVTNYHVIEDADTLSASFIDNQVYEAVAKGTNPENDLAVIAVPLESISDDTMNQIAIAAIGDSDEMNVGEQVVAIGNALGYGQSVTTGIVSALNRSISSETGNESESLTYIQTDAAITPGNSGGALLNMKGEVIGINSAKLSSTEIEGMGYAIPTSRASDIIERLMNQTTRTKVDASEQGTIGIQGIDVTSEIQAAYQIPQGIYISKITSGSAAEAAGIRPGSVLTTFDGQTISGVTALQELLQYYKAGESVELLLQVPTDGSYQEQTVTITLQSSNPV